MLKQGVELIDMESNQLFFRHFQILRHLIQTHEHSSVNGDLVSECFFQTGHAATEGESIILSIRAPPGNPCLSCGTIPYLASKAS